MCVEQLRLGFGNDGLSRLLSIDLAPNRPLLLLDLGFPYCGRRREVGSYHRVNE